MQSSWYQTCLKELKMDKDARKAVIVIDEITKKQNPNILINACSQLQIENTGANAVTYSVFGGERTLAAGATHTYNASPLLIYDNLKFIFSNGDSKAIVSQVRAAIYED